MSIYIPEKVDSFVPVLFDLLWFANVGEHRLDNGEGIPCCIIGLLSWLDPLKLLTYYDIESKRMGQGVIAEPAKGHALAMPCRKVGIGDEEFWITIWKDFLFESS